MTAAPAWARPWASACSMPTGRDLGPGGGALDRLARIDPSGRRPELEGIEVAVACDVTNPLCGPSGASAVYGPQKGATPAMVAVLDANLAHFAAIVERDLGVAIRDIPAPAPPGGWAAASSRLPGDGSSRGSTW